jgi:hypothetical protein
MPRIAYVESRNFRPDTLAIIDMADRIATDYKARGFNLTLRQLYYQFIARDFFPNSEKSYDKLGRIVNDARLAGLMDWEHVEDRGREAHGVDWHGHVPEDMPELIRRAQYGFSLDMWEGQDRRIEVWVEKQALEEVAERAASGFRLGYFACKGYVSQSEMWAAGRRMRDVAIDGQTPLVLHLGDHDPSGIDMTRDIQERLSMFAETDIEVRRIALNMAQINDLKPPPNPAKVTDSRFEAYRDIYGDESWELDAIEPEALVKLIQAEIRGELDASLFNEQLARETAGRAVFDEVADRFDEVAAGLDIDIDI